MRRFIDLTGQRFGRLLVIKQVGKSKTGGPLWLCQCICGKEIIVQSSNLKNGHTKSCGCLQKEIVTKHGYNKKGAKTRIYSIWEHIIQRCTNPNNSEYKNYGGRGITICNRWSNKKTWFINFLNDMGFPTSDKHQIDRIDNNKLINSYSPKNCRWTTRKINNRNKRDNHLITYNNKTQCLSAWAEEYDICPCVVKSRLKIGWTIKRALLTPVKKYKKKG